MATKSEAREPVLLSAVERHEIAEGLRLRREKLDKLRKGLEDQEIDTGAIDKVLLVHKGNGASGGLAQRVIMNNDSTREMFPDVKEPVGSIRQLEDILPGEDVSHALPLTAIGGVEGEDPAEPLWFDRSEIAKSLLGESALFGVAQVGGWAKALVEDADGEIFRVRVDVAVAFDHVGSRPPAVVDAAIAASEYSGARNSAIAPDGSVIEDVPGKKLEALRLLAVAAIENETTLVSAAREHLVSFARSDADIEWLRGWTANDLALGNRPMVPEDWEPYERTGANGKAEPAPKPAPAGTPLPDNRLEASVTFTDGGWKLAKEAGVTVEELGTVEPSATGGKYAKADVEGVIGARA